jgi:Ca2+-dependent lipid-binding protein
MIPKCPGTLKLFLIGCRNLIKADTWDQSDPFAEVKISKGDNNTLKTSTIDDNLNPECNFEGTFTMGLQKQEYVDIKWSHENLKYILLEGAGFGCLHIEMC